MKLFKWTQGRQEATKGISKLKIWIGKTFDVYLLKIPATTNGVVGWHFDEVPGKEHHRINIVLWGAFSFSYKDNSQNIGFGDEYKRQNIHTKDMFMGNFVKFRPDIMEHAGHANWTTVMLSIGWIK